MLFTMAAGSAPINGIHTERAGRNSRSMRGTLTTPGREPRPIPALKAEFNASPLK